MSLCSVSPHETPGTLQGIAHVQGLGHRAPPLSSASKKQIDAAGILWARSTFSLWSLFSFRLYKRSWRYTCKSQRSSAVPGAPGKDVATAATDPKHHYKIPNLGSRFPLLPDLKTRHTTPRSCVTSTQPLLEGFAVLGSSRWADARCLRPRGKKKQNPKATASTTGFGYRYPSVKQWLMAVRKKINTPYCPVAQGSLPPATPISAAFPPLAQAGATRRWTLSP